MPSRFHSSGGIVPERWMVQCRDTGSGSIPGSKTGYGTNSNGA
ncbi:MAG: hypothetical protein ABIF11_02485 [Nitrospirota bacterium]